MAIKKTKQNKTPQVARVRWRNHLKEIVFNNDAQAPLQLPRSACVSKADSVRFENENVYVNCSNGKAQLLPSYFQTENIQVGGINLELIVKEITSEGEFKAYKELADFHYRGNEICGRTAKLVVCNFHPSYPRVIGYVELATPLYMNKPRSAVMDAPFQYGDIGWDQWDMPTIKKHIHLIVRIARCVVYPEFRGIGLGKVLVEHAVEFAKHHWQVAQLKPLFIEISADMLKYVPFAEKAGMVFVGNTEGNLSRVAKDMGYLLRNRDRVDAKEIVKEESCGIVDQQVARMNHAVQIMEQEGWSYDDLLDRLETISEKSALKDFNLFHSIISLPKPTYMKGLVPEAQRFLENRSAKLKPENNGPPEIIEVEPISDVIELADLSIVRQSNVRRTNRTHAVQQAFGISPENIKHTIIKDLSLSLNAGDVLLLTGPSGSGKTSLLGLLANEKSYDFSGAISRPDNFRPGFFEPIKSQKALIETISNCEVREALSLMGMVGLSDAFIYLKRFQELSNGQQYRAMAANLISSGSNVWLADEFCAHLDPITANVVADRMQWLARKFKAVLVVASSQPSQIIEALKPDKVCRLTTAWDHSIFEGSAYSEILLGKNNNYTAPILEASFEELDRLRKGETSTVIRKGRLKVPKGPVFIVNHAASELRNVVDIRYRKLQLLNREEALLDGKEDAVSLQNELKKKLGASENSWITLINLS